MQAGICLLNREEDGTIPPANEFAGILVPIYQ